MINNIPFALLRPMLVFVLSSLSFMGYGQSLTVTGTNPSDKDSSDGELNFHGLTAGKTYNVNYVFNRTSVTGAGNPYAADVNGNLAVGGLKSGNYSDFEVTQSDTPNSKQYLYTTVTLVGGAIATQATKFYGAVLGNFTGVPDDDPATFVQTFARLSQPLNKIDGISTNSKLKKRLIFVRNFIIQFTYGSTDNFKTYSVDTLGDKYSNRLDLLSHAYLNGDASLNLVTLVVPRDWRCNKGDMAHIYLDLFGSFVATHVTDTFSKDDPSTTKSYTVESSLFGINLKASFVSHQFTIEAGAKVFEMHPWSSTINPNLNVQTSSISDVHLAQNASKSFVRQSNPPYFQIDFMVQYNTANLGQNSAANQSNNTSNSNAFIKFTHVNNFANPKGNHYPNSYFQLQLGYALDITKLLQGQPAAPSPTQ